MEKVIEISFLVSFLFFALLLLGCKDLNDLDFFEIRVVQNPTRRNGLAIFL